MLSANDISAPPCSRSPVVHSSGAQASRARTSSGSAASRTTPRPAANGIMATSDAKLSPAAASPPAPSSPAAPSPPAPSPATSPPAAPAPPTAVALASAPLTSAPPGSAAITPPSAAPASRPPGTLAAGAPSSTAPSPSPPTTSAFPVTRSSWPLSVCSARAARSSETTSSSRVWEKSSYHSPMARNRSGVSRQIRSSTSPARVDRAEGGATGTASRTRAAPCARATWHAARAVEPVAMPSSTRTAIRPASGSRGVSPRNRLVRRSSSARSRCSTALISAWLTPEYRTTSALMTRASPSPIAPMPSSGCAGTPSLRTRMTSSGAPRARATSAATATPPRGSPSTTMSLPRSGSRRLASWRPASDRSRKRMVTPFRRSGECVPSPGTSCAVRALGLTGLGDQTAQEGPGAGAVGAAGVLSCHEVGHPGLGQRADLIGHGVFIPDDGHVRRARGAFAVEHGPVGRQLTVDGEDPVGPLPGARGVAADADGQDAHDAGTGLARVLGGLPDHRHDVVAHRRGPGHPQHGAVGLLAGQAQHLRAEGGHHERHPAGRRGGQPYVRPHGHPGERDRLPVKEWQQDRQVLAHVQDRLAEVVTEHVLDHDPVRQADAQHQPAVHGSGDSTGLLREHGGVPGIGGHDRRADIDARHLAAGHRQRGQRVHAEDVAHPRGREAVIGRALQLIPQLGHCVRAGRILQRYANPHGAPPAPGPSGQPCSSPIVLPRARAPPPPRRPAPHCRRSA